MYIGASLCTALLRIWKARSVEKFREAGTFIVSGSLEQPSNEGRVNGHGDDGNKYFKIGKVRLWKRV